MTMTAISDVMMMYPQSCNIHRHCPRCDRDRKQRQHRVVSKTCPVPRDDVPTKTGHEAKKRNEEK